MLKIRRIILITLIFILVIPNTSVALTMQEILHGDVKQQGQVLGAATPAFVQISQNSVSGSSSISAGFTSVNTAGNAIIVYMFSTINASASYSISDTQGNVYNSAISFTGSRYNQIWYATNIKAGANTVTVNFGSASLGALLFIHEYSGISTTQPLDVTNSATGNGTILDSGNVAVSQPNELIFGAGEPANNISNAGAGFTRRGTLGSNITEDKVVASSGTYSASATSDGGAWDMLVATFKSADVSAPVSDTTAPTVPTNLSATAISSSGINLSWSASTDAVGVTGYKIYRNGSLLQTTNNQLTTYSDSGLSASTNYSYTVAAYDAAGNISSQSTSANATTQTAVVGASGDIYIAQTSAGLANGYTCANAYAVSFFNTAANWGTGTGKIGPGTTVHLCGVFTSGLTVQLSGTLGSPIIILFEPNAKISFQPWITPIAITASNRSYITIDGGNNGIIEALDNGSSASEDGTGLSFGHQVDATGIEASQVSNFTVRNLIIDNLYQRKFNSTTDSNRFGVGIHTSGSNIIIQHNTLTDGDAMIGVSWGPGAGTYHDILIDGNNIGRCNHGMSIGAYQANSSYLDKLTISNNRINDLDYWNGNSALHLDGIIIFDESPDYSGGISNTKIFNNFIGPNIGTVTTAAIFIISYEDSESINTQIYNNLFTILPEYNWSNGFIAASGKIYNNTFVGRTTAMSIGSKTPGASEVKNNLIYNDSPYGCTALAIKNVSSVASDNNLYACSGKLQNAIISTGGAYGFYYGLPAWRSATGYDTNTNLVADPKFVNAAAGNYSLLSSSPAINAGINLSQFFTTDKLGAARPSTGAWDIGAYQVSNGGVTAIPVAGDLNLDHIVNSLDFSLLNGKWNQSYSAYDLNGDGFINTFDYAVLKNNWGKTW